MDTDKQERLIEQFRAWRPRAVAPSLHNLPGPEARAQIESWTRKVFEAASIVRRGGSIDGMLFGASDIDTADPALHDAVDGAQKEWELLFVQRFGPDLLRQVKQETGFTLEPLRSDAVLTEAVGHLLTRLRDTQSATRAWRAVAPAFPDGEQLCFAHRQVPADQREHLERLITKLPDDVPLPTAVEALYAALDGLHVYFGRAPGGEVEWSDAFEPIISPLPHVQVFTHDNDTPFVTLGTSGRSYIAVCLRTGAMHLAPWASLHRTRKTHDDVLSFVNDLAHRFAYVDSRI